MNILECNGLVKRFGPTAALAGVTFAIQPGRIVGLLGPNGSGKTTLITLANGLLTPTAGEILINGLPPRQESHRLADYRSCPPLPLSSWYGCRISSQTRLSIFHYALS